MANITLDIPDEKLDEVKENMLLVFPNNEKNVDGTPRYTDNQWLKEKIRRFVIASVQKGKLQQAQLTMQASLEADVNQADGLVN